MNLKNKTIKELKEIFAAEGFNKPTGYWKITKQNLINLIELEWNIIEQAQKNKKETEEYEAKEKELEDYAKALHEANDKKEVERKANEAKRIKEEKAVINTAEIITNEVEERIQKTSKAEEYKVKNLVKPKKAKVKLTKLQKLKALDTSQLEIKQTFKNFRAWCEFLDHEYTHSEDRKIHFKTIEEAHGIKVIRQGNKIQVVSISC